jgi:hypothetical protein
MFLSLCLFTIVFIAETHPCGSEPMWAFYSAYVMTYNCTDYSMQKLLALSRTLLPCRIPLDMAVLTRPNIASYISKPLRPPSGDAKELHIIKSNVKHPVNYQAPGLKYINRLVASCLYEIAARRIVNAAGKARMPPTSTSYCKIDFWNSN